MPDFRFEDRALAAGRRRIAGLDEAGRGPWAGPVVAAAVIIDRDALPDDLARQLDDSKKLKATLRGTLLDELTHHADIGIGVAEAVEIDRLNILQATFLAMRRAVDNLSYTPDFALIDGNRLPSDLPCPCDCIVRGDGLSLSIAAASIAAKVHRDGVMAALAKTHPGYGWERNAGYGTKEHQAALARLGVTPAHRKSYRPIRNILGEAGT
ncbi:MAG: ribonuclease HII [Rhodospirillaceae bacterium]